MFSAYMQEGNLTIFIIFSLFYIHFCVGPQVCIGNSRLRIFTVCLGVVVSDTSSIYTHTLYFRHTSLTTFLFPPLAVHTRHFGCFTVMDRDRPAFVECCTFVPTCAIVWSVSFTRINREITYGISSPPSRKE